MANSGFFSSTFSKHEKIKLKKVSKTLVFPILTWVFRSYGDKVRPRRSRLLTSSFQTSSEKPGGLFWNLKKKKKNGKFGLLIKAGSITPHFELSKHGRNMVKLLKWNTWSMVFSNDFFFFCFRLTKKKIREIASNTYTSSKMAPDLKGFS